MVKNTRIRDSTSDKIFLVFIYFVLILFLFIILYPLLHIVSASISDSDAVTAGRVSIFPVEPTLIAYKTIFQSPDLIMGYANSIFYTVVGTIVQVSMTVLIAYPLSRKGIYGRGLIMGILVFTMFFNGGLIPTYLVVKELGLLDTRWAMIIPQALVVFQVIIARTFFQSTLPDELYEAAQLDGCNEFKIFLNIVLPLSKPIIAVLVLMYTVMNWNAYFEALIYLSSDKLFPLQLVLRNILIMNNPPGQIITDPVKLAAMKEVAELMKYALIVVASIPVLVLYPFIQKHLIKGVMIGSIKS
ncbi:carbohydrate ABC transporter permease [Neobacillus sp. NPDC093182]|uniref:carbohydrate ABC transporter permease n=1 Tax=Neobacillus sp. NPDC093182 TaxID=3364297 RepID=UPI0038135DC8